MINNKNNKETPPWDTPVHADSIGKASLVAAGDTYLAHCLAPATYHYYTRYTMPQNLAAVLKLLAVEAAVPLPAALHRQLAAWPSFFFSLDETQLRATGRRLEAAVAKYTGEAQKAQTKSIADLNTAARRKFLRTKIVAAGLALITPLYCDYLWTMPGPAHFIEIMVALGLVVVTTSMLRALEPAGFCRDHRDPRGVINSCSWFGVYPVPSLAGVNAGPQTVRHLLGPVVVAGPRGRQTAAAALDTTDSVRAVSGDDTELVASRDDLMAVPPHANSDSSEADWGPGSVTSFNPSTGLPLTEDNCGLDTGGHVVDQNWDYSFGPVDGGSSFNDDFGSV